MKLPSSISEWIKEVKYALEEAAIIFDESQNSKSEVGRTDFYKMASPIAAIYRSVLSEEIKKEMISVSWYNVQSAHKHIPAYKLKYKRCFVHAYLDSMIYLKVLSLKEAEEIIDMLEGKGIIEFWKD